MKGILKIDGDIFTFLNRLANLILINFLFLLFSVPIFTIGASFGALNQAVHELSNDQHLSVVKIFYRKFKTDFVSFSKVFILQMFGIVLLGLSYFIVVRRIPYLSLLYFVLLVIFFMFVELPYFLMSDSSKRSIQNIFRWSLFIIMKELPYMVVIISIPLCLFIVLPLISMHFIYFLLMFGLPLCVLLQQLILRFVLKKYEEEVK